MQGGEQSVVGQPAGLRPQKGVLLRPAGRPSSLPSPAQQGEAGFGQPPIVHPVQIRISGLPELVRGEQAVPGQVLQVQKPGVACKGGGGHIGGVAAARRHQGENLPPALSRCGKKVYKGSGAPSQGAHAAAAGERKDRKKNAAGTSGHGMRLQSDAVWCGGKSCGDHYTGFAGALQWIIPAAGKNGLHRHHIWGRKDLVIQ